MGSTQLRNLRYMPLLVRRRPKPADNRALNGVRSDPVGHAEAVGARVTQPADVDERLAAEYVGEGRVGVGGGFVWGKAGADGHLI